MYKRLDATLDAKAAGVSRTLHGSCSLVVALVIQAQTKLLHLVLMAFCMVASNAKVIVLAYSTVVTRFNVMFAFITGVDKSILALVVQLYQHTHRTPSGAP